MIKLNRQAELEILNSNRDLTLEDFEYDLSPINIEFFSDSDFPKQTLDNIYPSDLINLSLNLVETNINLNDIKLNSELILMGFKKRSNRITIIKE